MKSTDLRPNILNEEALADANYRPFTEPAELPLYNIMTAEALPPVSTTVTLASGTALTPITVEPLVKDQIDDYMSWPSYNINRVVKPRWITSGNPHGIPPWVNTATAANPLGIGPFTGVILSPRQCEAEEITGSGYEVKDVLHEFFYGGEYQTYETVAGVPADKALWESESAEPILTQIGESASFDPILEHHDRILSNMPSLLGLVQGALGLASILSLLSNPCSPLNDFMGSLMDKGKELMAGVKAKFDAIKLKVKGYIQSVKDVANNVIGSVKEELGPIIADIKSAATAVADIAGDVADMVANEISNIGKSLLAQLRQGLSAFLATLPDDPCLRSLAGSVLTGGAAALLG